MLKINLICLPIVSKNICFFIGTILISNLNILPLLAQSSINYNPPKDGNPPPEDEKDAGAPRPTCAQVDKPIQILAPKSNIPYTTEARPVFWVYVPYAAEKNTVTFRIWNQQQRTIYQTTFPLKNVPGIIKFALPNQAPELETNQVYRWDFKFNCGGGPEFDLAIGKIKRIDLPEFLKTTQNQASETEQIRIYAENGLWQEALTKLAEMRRQNPQNPTIETDWEALMSDPDVGLNSMIKEPIVNCCQTEQK